MKNYLTTKQAAALYGCNVNYIRQLIREEKIKAEKLEDNEKAAWLVDKVSFKNFLESRKNKVIL